MELPFLKRTWSSMTLECSESRHICKVWYTFMVEWLPMYVSLFVVTELLLYRIKSVGKVFTIICPIFSSEIRFGFTYKNIEAVDFERGIESYDNKSLVSRYMREVPTTYSSQSLSMYGSLLCTVPLLLDCNGSEREGFSMICVSVWKKALIYQKKIL